MLYRLPYVSLCAFFLLCLHCVKPIYAQTPIELEPIIVTVNRFAENAKDVGSATTIIDRAQIESTQAENLAELLVTVPGLNVFQSGGIGGSAAVSIRGAESDQTLVMIDGIRVNDPASTGSEFDFSVFSLANVERIEVIRGPQSGVYGSDAIGGVINIIMRKGGPGFNGVTEVEGGSYKTFAQRGSFSGSHEDFSLSAAASNFRTSGFSRYSGGTENDATRKQSIQARLDYDPAYNFGLTITGGRYKVDAELDSVGLSTSRDAADNVQRILTLASATARFDLLNGDLQSKLTAFSTRTDRAFFDDNGARSSPLTGRTSKFEGNSSGLEYQGELRVRDVDRLVVGGRLDYQNGAAFNEDSILGVTPRYDVSETWRSIFAIYSFNPTENLNITGAFRTDEFDDIATENTYRLTGAYRIPGTGTKLRSSYGTGAKSPTIQQRFENSSFAVGNPDLEVETSKGFDAGIDQDFFDGKVVLSGTYFSNAIENLIVTDCSSFPCIFENIDEAEIDGIELSASWNTAGWLTFKGAYTYLNAIDAATGLALRRRPEQTLNFQAIMHPAEDFSLTVKALYVGERFNRDDERDLLDDYIRIDLAGSYDLSANAELYFRAENIFDAEYEEVKDFGVAGRSGYVGLRARF